MKLQKLYSILNEGKTIEEISNELFLNIECNENDVFFDDDFVDFVSRYLNNTQYEINAKDQTISIYDDKISLVVDYKRLPNRFDRCLPYEILIKFDRLSMNEIPKRFSILKDLEDNSIDGIIVSTVTPINKIRDIIADVKQKCPYYNIDDIATELPQDVKIYTVWNTAFETIYY